MRLHWILLAALAVASPIAAQTSSQDRDRPEIVVEGSRDRDRTIQEFVDALTDAPFGGQLSRFDWAVCPAAIGLPELQNRAVTARLRDVAKAAGIRVAGARCRANALIIVADDKDEFLSALRRKHPAYFTDAWGAPMKLPDEPGPVAAWHVEGLLDSDGRPPPLNRGQEDGWTYFVVTSYDSMRLQPASRPHFAAGIVVLERRALAGLTTTQLADYAAMRIFARTDPDRLRKSKLPTILSVIDAPMGAATPVTLTEWDLGFLRALYASGDRQYAARQRHEMRRLLRNDLDKGQAPKKR